MRVLVSFGEGLAALAALFLTIYLWSWAVRGIYRVRTRPPLFLRAKAADGWELALFHRPSANRRFVEPVILCHGLCSNHHHFDFDPPFSIAHVLAAAGFECFSVDLRGTRASRHPPPGHHRHEVCADDHIDQDAPAILARVLEETGASQAFWVGHSMGGLIGYGVAQTPGGAQLKGLVALAAPVFFDYRPLLRLSLRIGGWLAWPYLFRQEVLSAAIAPFLGDITLPLSDVLVNPKHIAPKLQRKLYATLLSTVSRRLLLQFGDWATHDAFRSFDRTRDYRAGLASLTLPVLLMGGTQDQLAARGAIEAQYKQVGSTDKTLMLFGREMGDPLDYGHGDLVFGSGAPRAVYPKLQQWLEARATPLTAQNPQAVD
jgi:pimeloyl-ACP methyl ester carboxylesterase